MSIITYERGDRGLLKELACKLPPHAPLRYPDFVDHYYAGSPWCRLYLVTADDGQILAVLGVERMRFECAGRTMTIGFGSNFRAFQSGAGGLLFFHWLKSCDLALVFGGSKDTQALVRQQRWTVYESAKQFQMNRAFADSPGQPFWAKLAKQVLKRVGPREDVAEAAMNAARDGDAEVEAIEQREFTDDLLPKQSPFDFRFSPTADYLNWRYNTELSFVRYRVFRLVAQGDTIGYTVINQQPDRSIVAHCDGTDHLLLMRGVFAALATACQGKPRGHGVLLASSHPAMCGMLRKHGFHERPRKKPLLLGGLKSKPPANDREQNWLVNYDWGDNGLRPPFLGRPAL